MDLSQTNRRLALKDGLVRVSADVEWVVLVVVNVNGIDGVLLAHLEDFAGLNPN